MEPRALRFLKWGALFTFLDFNFGTLNVLPDFAGMLLFLASIQAHDRPTQAEKGLRPLLWILAADDFLHWIYPFENGLETLLIWVISLYTVYVLLGEVAGRIRGEQPGKAGILGGIRVCHVLL